MSSVFLALSYFEVAFISLLIVVLCTVYTLIIGVDELIKINNGNGVSISTKFHCFKKNRFQFNQSFFNHKLSLGLYKTAHELFSGWLYWHIWNTFFDGWRDSHVKCSTFYNKFCHLISSAAQTLSVHANWASLGSWITIQSGKPKISKYFKVRPQHCTRRKWNAKTLKRHHGCTVRHRHKYSLNENQIL